MDVDFMLTDTFELIRPGMTLFKSFDDAGRAVDELMATQALQPTGASSRCRELKTGPASDLLDCGPQLPRTATSRQTAATTTATMTTGVTTILATIRFTAPGSTTATLRVRMRPTASLMATFSLATTATRISSSAASPRTRSRRRRRTSSTRSLPSCSSTRATARRATARSTSPSLTRPSR